MAGKRRGIIIGMDGVPHPLITRYVSDGTMPNMGRILGDGTLRKMESTVPDISCVAWSTIITGKNPGEHDIYGFMNLAPDTYDFSFPNFNDLKAKTFWEEAPERRYVIVNIPATYPARELNGVLISGFVALDLPKATYPRFLVPRLHELGYRIDVDAMKGHEDMDAFIEDLDRTLEARIRTYRYLWDNEEWDIFFLVFTGTDRLGHFLFEAFENESHPYAGAFRDHFRKLDDVVGEIYGKVGADDLFMMLSDHGFGVIEKEINVNYFLKEKGFLNIENATPDSFNGVADGSRAFALDPARIHVNLTDRYPRGCVKPDDRAKVAEEIAAAFEELTVDGRPVVRKICRREETFSGPYLDKAPDLVVLPHKGFDLKARLVAKGLTRKGVFTGKHTQDDAFLFVRSSAIPQSDIPGSPWVGDVRRLIEQGVS
ncbi:MAG: alkaline phosphatase family protein [Candidatus Tritonobacter lacicola]|nr:alkaline phosphatase family protein [Candidatus Tritonobacter lacicola]